MIRRAAIYARFSSDLQNERSCQDQVDYCTTWAGRNELTVVASYSDEAVSGASAINRLGLARMLRAARERQFDVLLCEDLDRIARKQADLHRIRDELTFLGIAIMTVADGTITAMHAGLKGLMSEMYLTDLANKTRRGLRSRVAEGNSGGGRSYGYDLVPGAAGRHVVNEREADIVRRIFSEYLSGSTPREIVAHLNAEGIPSPRGGSWNASTINGSKQRGNGILQNRLYIGEIVWNRQRFIKDPSTGKRISRPNPESEWLRSEVPHMAIVERTVFDAAQDRKAERTTERSSNPTPAKPRHLLSGLLKCGCCGASYAIVGRDRLGCVGYRERGDCNNNRSVTREHVERRVLEGLRNNLADPDLMAEYVRSYHEAMRELASTQTNDRAAIERRLAELSRGIQRIVDKVVDGTAPDALMTRLVEMEAEEKSLKASLAQIDEDFVPVALHPGAIEKYRRIVEDLQAHIDSTHAGAPTDALLAAARKLIGKVVITPTENKKPVNITLHGLLAELLLVQGTPQYRGALVAGAGFEPATFRL